MNHTSNQVPNKPLPVIPGDPGQEGKQTIEIEPDFSPGRRMFFDPIPGSGFGFEIGESVHGAGREGGFASRNGVFVGIQRIPIGDLDPQGLSQAMTSLGCKFIRHDDRFW